MAWSDHEAEHDAALVARLPADRLAEMAVALDRLAERSADGAPLARRLADFARARLTPH